MQPAIYVDIRCLQDPEYRSRGIGSHTTALLRARGNSRLANRKTIGLIDAQLPSLPSEFHRLVDDISYSSNPCTDGSRHVYIDFSPMTHDGRFGLRFQNHPGFLKAAVLYDFIPLDWHGYLPTVAARIQYLAKIARLNSFDLFFPISEYTAERTRDLLGVSPNRITVTGASVRTSLYAARERSTLTANPFSEAEPFFVTIGGDDHRKNTEAAVQAVRNLNLMQSRPIWLRVLGHHDPVIRGRLLQIAQHAEGQGFLKFESALPDEAVVPLFAGAIAAIAPSHIEGFSLPIPEASVCGCPVIASNCAAQMELIDDPQALFSPSDIGSLTNTLAKLLQHPSLRKSLVLKQAHLSHKFHEDAVGSRFWQALEHATDAVVSAPISKQTKPFLAFLSPFPPDQSGVALYTANTIRAGESFFSSDLYSEASRPLTFNANLRDAGKVSLAPITSNKYNAIISVLGDSPYHTSIFEFFERYGGPCILHDARLVHIYFHRLGQENFLKLAARLLNRTVSVEEANVWLQDRNLSSAFVEPIIERASPLIVHTVTQQKILNERYGARAYVNSCCPNHTFSEAELAPSARRSARERLRITDAVFAIATFGHVARVKAPDAAIIAIDFLRSWGISADLYFVGNTHGMNEEIERVANLYGISQHVHCLDGFLDEGRYRDFLIAADAGLQLRTSGFGQFSAALTDCISAGLPCVASRDLALSSDSPEYVRTVADRFSPLHIAEELATIWETRTVPSNNRDRRAAYLETHNFTFYGKRLLEILQLA